MNEQAKVKFYDGQRVRREDLAFLQENLLSNHAYLGSVLGRKGVVWGFRTTAVDNATLWVEKGLAFDGFVRPIIHPEACPLQICHGDDLLFACVNYTTRVAENKGQPVRIENNYGLSIKKASEIDGINDVVFAQIQPRDGGYDIIQNGEWFIPPVHARHSGLFFEDAQGRWRYDGDPVVSSLGPDFDTGWIGLEPETDINIPHGLGSADLLVQLEQKTGGVVSNRGIGSDFYYELHDTSVIRLTNSSLEALSLCARLWRLDARVSAESAPVSDAGMDSTAEPGESFNLDGSDSMAFNGRSVVRYRWSLIE
jgi:hypothetical protein